jgi:hypothetical protein
MTCKTSEGLTLPRLAWPKVRINVMVIKIEIKTTKLDQKLRPRSLRNEEWNNMAAKEKLNYELRNPKTFFVHGDSR